MTELDALAPDRRVEPEADTGLEWVPLSEATLRGLREIWWRHAAIGHPLPAQLGVILIEGALA